MLNISYLLACSASRNVVKRTGLKVVMKRTQKTSRSRKNHENLRYIVSKYILRPWLTVIKPPKNSDIGTANIPHNDNIRSLRERWTCQTKPGCSSEHCFINPVNFSHFPLAHKHFDTWVQSTACPPGRLAA